MSWEEFDKNKKYEEGYYLVMHREWFRYPMRACYHGGSFVVGPHSHFLPSSLPIEVTHVWKVPDTSDVF